MIIDLTVLAAPIELAAAQATVNEWGVDSVWAAPTPKGACLRASLCLLAGHNPAEVADALARFEDSTVSPC